jgi:hypothetical protein
VRTGEVANSGPPQGSEINFVPLDEAQARFPGLADGSDDESPGSDPGEFFLILTGEGEPSDQREEPGPPMADPDQESPAGLLKARTRNHCSRLTGSLRSRLPSINGPFKIDVIFKNKTAHIGS